MTKQPTTRVAIVRSTAFLSVDAHRFRWARRQYAPSSRPKLAKRRAAELLHLQDRVFRAFDQPYGLGRGTVDARAVRRRNLDAASGDKRETKARQIKLQVGGAPALTEKTKH
jgi:hypothetical protein